jgi:YD repeat-containing protein
MSIGRDNKMPSRIGHGVLISITVIALLFVSVMTSYSETINYIYDELNRQIQVIYEDGRVVTYTYDASGNRITLTQNVDTVPPTGTITINSGDAVTYNPAVILTLPCSDNVGCSQMQFSNDNVTYSTPEAYDT